MTATLKLLTMPDGLLAVRHEPAPAPAISDADRERWALVTAEVRELREANPVPVPGWRKEMDAAVTMPSKTPCEVCEEPASPVSRLCPTHEEARQRAIEQTPLAVPVETLNMLWEQTGGAFGPDPDAYGLAVEREYQRLNPKPPVCEFCGQPETDDDPDSELGLAGNDSVSSDDRILVCQRPKCRGEF